MLPEEWKSIRHLLLLCILDDIDVLSPVLQVINLIRSKLPKTDIQWLILAGKTYQFYRIQHEVDRETFHLALSPLENYLHLIEQIKTWPIDLAVILTTPEQSPFSLAYLCYLANIPIRLGQSQEFGGGVLSHCIQPPATPVDIADYHLHLLKSTGFPGLDPVDLAIA